MGGRMVEIKFDIFTMKKSWVEERWKRKFYIFTIEKCEKKMGGRTVEIKFCIFTIEKREKKMGRETVEMQFLYIYYEKKRKKMGG